MQQRMALPAFDPDFASPSDWAAMYRAVGLQVVPARYPMRDRTDKRPALANWREFQNDLAPQAVFDRWYGWPDGEHVRTPNMGVVSGAASGNTIVIDLDEHSKTSATWWWRGLLELHNHGGEPETWSQVTGGGGRQLFFRAPADWHAPTNRTPIGVDIRGQGGFAMLPPSVHLSGKEYAWAPGYSPWETDLADAPQWLLDAIDDLVLQHGGDTHGLTQVAERTESPATDFDPFGARIDGREDAMTRLVWGAVVAMHRATAGSVTEDVAREHFDRALEKWLREAKTRLTGVDNATGLERECRGASMFLAKWQRAMKRWETKVAADAKAERPAGEKPASAEHLAGIVVPADRPRFPFEKVGDLRSLPPAQWLVKDWIPERSSGIFYGKWAAGKSFIGFDLALHLAYGMTDWHGVPLPGVPVHVLILAREGHTGFVGRIDAFKTHYGLIDDPPHLTFMRASVSFMRDEDFAALCEAVRAQGEAYRLVLVDTVARAMPGVEMSKPEAVTMFTERCQALAEVTGAAAIGVHHQNKSGEMMGSVYFEANSDFVFEVTRLGEDDGPLTAGEITCTKQKDGEDKWKRSVRYAKVSTSQIDPDRASLVVEKIGEEAAPEPKKGEAWPDRDVCDRVLAAIREAWASKKPWSNAVQARVAGRYAVERMARQFSIKPSVAEMMLHEWLLNDVLAVEQVDSHSKSMGLKVIGVIR